MCFILWIRRKFWSGQYLRKMQHSILYQSILICSLPDPLTPITCRHSHFSQSPFRKRREHKTRTYMEGITLENDCKHQGQRDSGTTQKKEKKYMGHFQVRRDRKQLGHDPLGPSKEPCRMSFRIMHLRDRKGQHLFTTICPCFVKSYPPGINFLSYNVCKAGLLLATGIQLICRGTIGHKFRESQCR